MGEELKNIADAAGKGFSEGNSVIDTSGISKRLDKVVGEVLDHGCPIPSTSSFGTWAMPM